MSDLQPPHEGTREVHASNGRHGVNVAATASRRMVLGLGAVAGIAAATGVLAWKPWQHPETAQSGSTASSSGISPVLRLGYFANVTHAPALIAVHRGILSDLVKPHGTSVKTQVFNAGPDTIEALSAGAIDAAYLGPSPAINSYLKSKGRSLFVVAGATSGGASLVVNQKFATVQDLVNAPSAKLASPQLGGTQDIALRLWLQQNNAKNVQVNPVSNSETLALFKQGQIDGAWLPEPWATRLVDAGAKRLLDERDLWPDRVFPTTVLVVNQDFAQKYPRTVDELVAANSASVDWLNQNQGSTTANSSSTGPSIAAQAIDDALKQEGSTLPVAVVTESLKFLKFTSDPLARTYPTLLQNAVKVGLAKSPGPKALDGIVRTI